MEEESSQLAIRFRASRPCVENRLRAQSLTKVSLEASGMPRLQSGCLGNGFAADMISKFNPFRSRLQYVDVRSILVPALWGVALSWL